jgi:hypothetical protein
MAAIGVRTSGRLYESQVAPERFAFAKNQSERAFFSFFYESSKTLLVAAPPSAPLRVTKVKGRYQRLRSR